MEIKRLKYVNKTKVINGIKISYFNNFTEEGKVEKGYHLKHTNIFNSFGILKEGRIYEIEFIGSRVFSISDHRQKTLVKGNGFITIDLSTGNRKLPNKREIEYWEEFLKNGGDKNTKLEL